VAGYRLEVLEGIGFEGSHPLDKIAGFSQSGVVRKISKAKFPEIPASTRNAKTGDRAKTDIYKERI
jgi:hypothetical protein